jgi:hypothetical protein
LEAAHIFRIRQIKPLANGLLLQADVEGIVTGSLRWISVAGPGDPGRNADSCENQHNYYDPVFRDMQIMSAQGDANDDDQKS